MIHYKISSQNPASHYIDVKITIDAISNSSLELQLPAWRPGRYELGNFAKNIKRFEAYDENANSLLVSKNSKDLWKIETNQSKKIIVTYSYHTTEINAGNCYADAAQLYVNPVHLCMYVPQRVDEQHIVELQIPDSYKVATSLPNKNNVLTAQSFDELADSPFIASAHLQSDFFELDGVKFWLHFNGECKPDWDKIKSDFIKFTETQIRFWGVFPVKEYHYLFQILPYKFYHGVEHQHSTVIALGAGYNINNGITYESLLGVSSHELFHTWNIKYIRPKEMLPYDFTKENYARTGYVYEGFTTYYGDVLLLTSGVFTNEQYFETLEERLQKHFHNEGRFNLSVTNSSWDTWLDGYAVGAPHRKTSIYDEGNLIALMLDVLIMKHTNNAKGLKDVCRKLYNNFGKQQKGYTEQDVVSICEEIAGTSLQSFFNDYVYGTQNFEIPLLECFDYLGIEMKHIPSTHISENSFGFKTVEFMHNRKVSLIATNSPGWLAGLSIGDEIIAVNGYTLKNDFNDWMLYFKNNNIVLTVLSSQQLKTINLFPNKNTEAYFSIPKLKLTHSSSKNYDLWKIMNS